MKYILKILILCVLCTAFGCVHTAPPSSVPQNNATPPTRDAWFGKEFNLSWYNGSVSRGCEEQCKERGHCLKDGAACVVSREIDCVASPQCRGVSCHIEDRRCILTDGSPPPQTALVEPSLQPERTAPKSQPIAKTTPKPASVAVVAAHRPQGSGVSVFDFCAMKGESIEGTYTKKKLFMFNMSGLELVERGEKVVAEDNSPRGTRHVLREIQGGELFRDVWTMTFPMRRFYNIISPFEAGGSWETQDTIPLKEALRSAKAPHARFMRDALRCTDFVAVPTLVEFEATWREAETEVTVIIRGKPVKKKVKTWSLRTVPHVALRVYRRSGTTFALVDTVTAKGGGFFDFVTDLGAVTLSTAAPGAGAASDTFQSVADRFGPSIRALRIALDNAQRLRESIRQNDRTLKSPEALEIVHRIADLTRQVDAMEKILADPQGFSDRLARANNGGWDGLVSGVPLDAGEEKPQTSDRSKKATYRATQGLPLRAPFWLKERSVGVAGLSQRSGIDCKLATDLPNLARCELRVRAENISLLVQNESKEIDGWRLYAPLRVIATFDSVETGGNADEGVGFSLGSKEGVRPGAVYWATSTNAEGDRERSGFARVISSGPGGTLGLADPSELTFRAGDATLGARMEEHPQIGVSVLPQYINTLSISLQDLRPSLAEGEGNFAAPTTLYGLSLGVGYSLTPYLGFSLGEAWLSTDFEVLFGSQDSEDAGSEALSWAALSAFAGPEFSLDLIRRLDLFGFVLGGVSVLSVQDPNNQVTVEGEKKDDSAAGYSPALKTGAGLNLLLHPDWRIRFAYTYRLNFQDMTLTNDSIDDNSPNPSRLHNTEAGNLTGSSIQAGVTYIF